MSINRSNNNLSYGLNNALQSANPEYIFAQRIPSSSDSASFGTFWFYRGNGISPRIFIYLNAGLWVEVSSSESVPVFASIIVNGPTILNGALTVASGTSAINISADAAATTVNIATGAGVKTLSIGSTNSTSSTVIHSGTGGISLASTSTGDITLASSDTLLLDSAGVLELNSSAGVISIGNDAVAQNINVGTGAAARIITMGNVTGATAVNVNTGTAGYTLTTTNGAYNLSTGTGTINIGINNASKAIVMGTLVDASPCTINTGYGAFNVNSAVGGGVNLATNSIQQTVLVGNAVAGTNIELISGDGGIFMHTTPEGLIKMRANKPVAGGSLSITCNASIGFLQVTGLTTAAGATETLVLSNTNVDPLITGVIAVASNLNTSTNGAQMVVNGIYPTLHTATIKIKNNGGGALGAGDTLFLSFIVLG